MNKRTVVNILSYFAMVILLAVVFWIFIKKDELELLCKIDLLSFSVLIVFTIVFYMLGGLQYYFLKDMYGVNLEKKDILLLPVAMNLWSFLVPIQGSSIFFMLFLKHRHNVKISDGLSITIFLYLITVFFAGLVGVIFVVLYHKVISLFSLISLIFLLNPLFIVIGYRILCLFPDFRFKFINKIFSFFKETIRSINNMWLSFKHVALFLLLIILRMIFTAFWYMWIARVLGYQNVTFLSLLLLALWLTVSLIIRITPNNWGLLQLISGFMFSLVSLSPEQGVMISLVASAFLTIVAFTVGVGANLYYLKSWNIKSIRDAVNEK